MLRIGIGHHLSWHVGKAVTRCRRLTAARPMTDDARTLCGGGAMDHPGVRSDKQRAVGAVPAWFHSFDFGDGAQAFGYVSLEALRYRATLMPDVRGKSVLDINTFDGADAFGCEQRGAARVVAMDYFCWAMDLGHHFQVYREDRARGLSPAPPREMPYWHPDTMPGKVGFDTAHRLLESRVE